MPTGGGTCTSTRSRSEKDAENKDTKDTKDPKDSKRESKMSKELSKELVNQAAAAPKGVSVSIEKEFKKIEKSDGISV